MLDASGRDILPDLEDGPGSDGKDIVLSLTEREQQFRFRNVSEAPVVSVARGFSAPVIVAANRDDQGLAFLAGHDSDAFNRWDAAQEFATAVILRGIDGKRAGRTPPANDAFVESFARTLREQRLDRALIAEALMLPGESYLADRMTTIDVDAIHEVRRSLRRRLASALEEDFRSVYRSNLSNEIYRYDSESAGRRSLKNLSLSYLMELDASSAAPGC